MTEPSDLADRATMIADMRKRDAIAYTVEVVTSLKVDLINNKISDVIAEVHAAISKLYGATPEPAVTEERKPAVQISKSVTPDFVICLEDGKRFKSLKRHLRTQYNLTPEEYRERWGLKRDYPMVAPNYSARRSQLAKDNGLGKKN